jgi:septal ring factor EnvC (AmiA/AmiB activator)
MEEGPLCDIGVARFSDLESVYRRKPGRARFPSRLSSLMKPWFRVIGATTLALSAVTSARGAPDEDIKARQKALTEVEQQMQGLRKDLAAKRGDRDALQANLERLDRDIADLAVAGQQLDAMVAEQQRAVADLQARLAQERQALAGEQELLGRLLRSAYIVGRSDRMQLLLNQNDATKVSRVVGYYSYLNHYRVTRISEINARARKLGRLRRESAQESARLSALAAHQEETRMRLTAARGERQTLLAALDKTIASEEQRFKGLKADAQGLRQLIEQLQRRAQALPEASLKEEPITDQKGKLAWPLAKGHLVHRFGQRKLDGQRWDGVLIAAPEGEKVRAIYAGRVVYADWLRGFGMLLIIEHGDGYMSLYGHNQALLKERGEWVAAGDVIALAGSSGGERSPGLYFAIRYHGRPVDPAKWCRAAGIRTGARPMPQDARQRFERSAQRTLPETVQESLHCCTRLSPCATGPCATGCAAGGACTGPPRRRCCLLTLSNL